MVFFAYVETRGPTLEEIARLFDGDDAAVGGLDLNTVHAISEAGEKGEKIDPEHLEHEVAVPVKV